MAAFFAVWPLYIVPSSVLPIGYVIVATLILLAIPDYRRSVHAPAASFALLLAVVGLWLLSQSQPTARVIWLVMGFSVVWWLVVVVIATRSQEKTPRCAWRANLLLAFPLIIAFVSSGKGGPGLFTMIAEHLDANSAAVFELACRKTIHFVFYGSTALMAMNAARIGKASASGVWLIGLGFSGALAVFDELRQSGFANRTGSWSDVLLDLSGAVVFMGISAFTASRQQRDASSL
jgi:VanZ family protein